MDWDDILQVLDDAGLEPPTPGWVQRAQCRNMAPAEADRIFFPQGRKGQGWTAEADEYCAFCPAGMDFSCVAQEFIDCLRAPTRLITDQIYGIRASMPAEDRRRILAAALRRWEHRNQLKVSA